MEPVRNHLKYVCECVLELAEAPGEASGSPRSVAITGGRVEGLRLHGLIVEQCVAARAVFSGARGELDTSYEMRTHDGAVVRMRHFGLRHGPEHVRDAMTRGEVIESPERYLRTHPRFETNDPRYQWLNGLVAVGSGAHESRALTLTIYEVI